MTKKEKYIPKALRNPMIKSKKVLKRQKKLLKMERQK